VPQIANKSFVVLCPDPTSPNPWASFRIWRQPWNHKIIAAYWSNWSWRNLLWYNVFTKLCAGCLQGLFPI